MNSERPSYRRESNDNGLENQTETKKRKIFDGNEGFRRSGDGCPCCQTRQQITVHDEVRVVNYLIVNGQVLRALDLEIWKKLAKTILPEGQGPSPFALYHRFFLQILPRYKIFPLSKELEQQFEELLQRSQGLFMESSTGRIHENSGCNPRWTLNSGGIGTSPRRGDCDDNGESITEFKTPDKYLEGFKTSPKSSKKGRNYTRAEDQALFNLLICYNMIKRGGYRRTWEEIANQGAPGLEKRTAASMHSRYSVIRQNYEQYIDDPDTRAVFREVEEERVKVEAKRKPVKVE